MNMVLGWFEDWKLNEPTVYTETVEERRQLMLPLNNSELIKHIEEYYGVIEGEIWTYINSNC